MHLEARGGKKGKKKNGFKGLTIGAVISGLWVQTFFFPTFLLPVRFSGLESLFIVFSFFLQKFSLGFYVCCFVLCLASCFSFSLRILLASAGYGMVCMKLSDDMGLLWRWWWLVPVVQLWVMVYWMSRSVGEGGWLPYGVGGNEKCGRLGMVLLILLRFFNFFSTYAHFPVCC